MNRRQLLWSAAGVVLAAGARPGVAQPTYPSKPIRLVVPFPPGGSTDVAARSLGDKLARELGQPVLVDNRPGAGTTIAAAYVASAPADGYTLFITGTVSHASAAALYKKLPYDPVKSFVPVALLTESPFILVVNAESRFKSLRDLVQAGRARPAAVSYASSGNGAAPHLIAEMLSRSVGATYLHVPYKGVGPALTALLAGEVQFSVADVGALPHINQGKLRALAVLSAKPSAMVPGIPGLAEAGVRGIDVSSNLGILAPAGTPATVLTVLHAAINKALNDDEIKAKLAGLGQQAAPRGREEFGSILAADVQKYTAVVAEAGVTID